MSVRNLAVATAWLLLLAGIGGGILGLARVRHLQMVTAFTLAPTPNPYALMLVELRLNLKGRVVMTNVYPTTVGFFTEEAALGACERDAFPDDGRVDPSRCHVAFVRGFGKGPTVAPTHYVLFHDLFTGFTRCRGDCLRAFRDTLAARFVTLHENRLYSVFDLTRASPGGAASSKDAGTGSPRV